MHVRTRHTETAVHFNRRLNDTFTRGTNSNEGQKDGSSKVLGYDSKHHSLIPESDIQILRATNVLDENTGRRVVEETEMRERGEESSGDGTGETSFVDPNNDQLLNQENNEGVATGGGVVNQASQGD